MNIQHFTQKKPSNVLPFNKNRKRTYIRPRPHNHTGSSESSKNKPTLLSKTLQLISTPATLLFFVTSSLFQTLLRIVYGCLLTIGLILLAFAGMLALFADGKTPAHFWQSVWHGESVLLLLALGGFLLDGVLIAIQITIGATRTSKPRKA